MQTHPTPRAASAIIAQMTCKADGEYTRYAEINGVEHEFTLFFTTEWHRDRGDIGVMSDWAECEIVGAWAEDLETGDVAWAGNRRELDALLGDKLTGEWEADVSQSQTDGGLW